MHPRYSFIFQQLLQDNKSKSEKEREEANKHAMQEEEDEEDEDDGYLHGQTGDLLPDIDVLRTFSPMIVHEKVIQQSGNDVDSKQAPATRTHYAAVLFADISGFTRLANVLSVEQLQLHISKYFTKLFSCVERLSCRHSLLHLRLTSWSWWNCTLEFATSFRPWKAFRCLTPY
jgi:hypothetical protein